MVRKDVTASSSVRITVDFPETIFLRTTSFSARRTRNNESVVCFTTGFQKVKRERGHSGTVHFEGNSTWAGASGSSTF